MDRGYSTHTIQYRTVLVLYSDGIYCFFWVKHMQLEYERNYINNCIYCTACTAMTNDLKQLVQTLSSCNIMLIYLDRDYNTHTIQYYLFCISMVFIVFFG